MRTRCVECKYHEHWVDEIDGELFDDGCDCHNEKAIGYHFTNCPCYEDDDKLSGCPYFEPDMQGVLSDD